MTMRVETLTGAAFANALPALARLRIEVFRAWPYLYDGTLDYEEKYLDKFSKTKGAVIVAAFDRAEVVGCATASPLLGHADEFAKPFAAAGYDPSRVFYFGESVLRVAYRGRGIGHAFFDHREAAARKAGGFDTLAFCGVVRPDDHALKPKDYVPLDVFWMKRGFRKEARLVTEFDWKDIDTPAKTAKKMQFWVKPLEGVAR
jgi:GNAT superfamily N-acetyltransferase